MMRGLLEYAVQTGPPAVVALALALLLYAIYCTEWLRGPFHRKRVYRYFSSKHPRLHWPNQHAAREEGAPYRPLPFLDHLALGTVHSIAASANPAQPSAFVPCDSAAAPSAPRAPAAAPIAPAGPEPTAPSAPTSRGPAPVPSKGLASPTVRVVSWNIEFAYCLSSIVAQLKELSADVILLQEVDILDDGSSFSLNSLQAIADALGMHGVWAAHHQYTFAPNTTERLTEPRCAQPHECTGRGAWGCGILSRFPLSQAESIRFDDIVPGYGRSALTAVVQAPAPIGEFRVYSTHLEVVTGIEGRLHQFARVMKHCSAQPKLPTLIAGDFNTLASGFLRFVPFYCTDKYRFFSIGQSEPEWWQDNVFSRPGQLGYGFKDVFPVDAPTLDHWLVQPKLDWMLTRGVTSVHSEIGDGRNRPSDHRYLLSDCVIGAQSS